MKKLVAVLTILFASVLCTACINNFAIQELNNKAQESLRTGDVETAICRLQSSVDLDENLFETRYNLAVALTQAGKYKKAKEQIEVALNMKPTIPEVYYTKGVVLEGIGANIIDNVEVNSFCELLKNERFTSYSRRGKYLIFTLDTKVLVCHLRMEGKFMLRKI